MKKEFLILILFTFSVQLHSQAIRPQGIKLSVSERTKQGSKPIASGQVEITLNDSIKRVLSPDAEGSLGVIPLAQGSFTIKCKYRDCQIAEVKNIVVGEGKTAYVTLALTCPSYIRSLSKRERKKLGYN